MHHEARSGPESASLRVAAARPRHASAGRGSPRDGTPWAFFMACGRIGTACYIELMLTARGFWFLVTLLVLLGLAVAGNAVALVLVALTLLSWFFSQWLLFQGRLRRGH